MWLRIRDDDDDSEVIDYVSPEAEVNAGLWTLFAGATILLSLRVWVKVTRRHGLWYDDWILVASWIVLLCTNAVISHEYATGYVVQNGAKWDDRMHILINISSCGTLIGQSWSKSAFGVTLLKLSNRWQQCFLWFCIITMNVFMISRVFVQWGKICNSKSYDVWYRLDFCLNKKFRDDFKEAGQVYNIVMDFIFAFFPWMITWKLDMRRAEKIGLCVAMSLGVIIAIIAAARTAWKDDGNKRDTLYYWRNGMSNIWYSSEVAGTIMVQCIPVLRPFLRDVTASLTSKRLHSTNETHPKTIGSQTTAARSSKAYLDDIPVNDFDFGFSDTKITAGIELNRISSSTIHEKSLTDRSLGTIPEVMDEEKSIKGRDF